MAKNAVPLGDVFPTAPADPEPAKKPKRKTDPVLVLAARLDRQFAAMPPEQRQWVLSFLRRKYEAPAPVNGECTQPGFGGRLVSQ